MMLKAFWILIPALLLTVTSFSWAGNIGKNVYGIYSETYPGMQFDVYNPTSPVNRDGGYMGAWPSGTVTTLMDDTIAEPTTYCDGSKALKVTVAAGYCGGVWTQFGYDGTTAPPKVRTYMYDYNAGTLEFSVKTAYDIAISAEWTRGSIPMPAYKRMLSGFKVPLDNQWHTVTVKLSTFTGILLTSITVPVAFSIVGDSTTYERTFWIDNVRWVKNPMAQGLPDIALLRGLTDDTTQSLISWSDVGATTRWKCADQFIEYQLGYSTPAWAIQVYTDNTAEGAYPKYTGLISSYTSAAGLVCSSDTAATPLPMCWRISDYRLDVDTLTIADSADFKHLYCPALGEDNGFYPWLYIKDKSDPDFNNAAAQEYMTLWDLRGIHYGEGEWGPAMSPNYIYIGANFGNAVNGRGYITNELVIRLFSD